MGFGQVHMTCSTIFLSFTKFLIRQILEILNSVKTTGFSSQALAAVGLHQILENVSFLKLHQVFLNPAVA